MENDICKIEQCTGCMACYNVCSHDAIDMLPNDVGEKYPKIDMTKCVNCGLCKKICPANIQVVQRYPISCYAAISKNKDELLRSPSGGIASILSAYVIETGGVVYGCTGEDICNVHHIRIDSLSDIERLRGSKYVQSYIGNTYRLVREDVKEGTKVLFIGVPCQVAGLHSYLGKSYENLITVDLVCHGTPSQKLLNDNLKHYGIKSNDGTVNFRRKKYIPKFNSAKCRIEYGFFLTEKSIFKLEKNLYEDNYIIGFLNGLYFRESCYSCKYATACRASDITVSDFWGLGNDAGFNKGEGVSNVFINTNKGKRLWDDVRERVRCVERNRVEAIVGNAQLQRPMKRHPKFYRFRKLYTQYGFVRAVRKCTKMDVVKMRYLIPLIGFAKKVLCKV